jgi:hypothetical protein
VSGLAFGDCMLFLGKEMRRMVSFSAQALRKIAAS